MEIIRSVEEMQKRSESIRLLNKKIGFVPTMGALHEGHISLFCKAREICDVFVVSIFVNPTQFSQGEDYDRYPRDFKGDEMKCENSGVDIIFYPDKDEIYPDDFSTFVEVRKLSDIMCGRSRPGHFSGVATIVIKLFNIVKPHFAVFGEKDYQQLIIIKRMVHDLNLNVEIISAPTVRESDGLAMSSRNVYLNEGERRQAKSIYRSLISAENLIREGERNPEVIKEKIRWIIEKNSLCRIDYIEIRDAENLSKIDIIKRRTLIAIACFVGDKTRLIDNIVVEI
ncbi:MAG: pantoate--beta-alanine ligase [bacterium]